MYRLVYSAIVLLASFILPHSRHTVFISQNGAKSYIPSSSETDVCMTPKCVIAAANVLTSLDESVDPCDDFYSFACGGWMKRQEVSDDQPRIHLLTSTQNNLNRELRELLESKYESSDPPFVKHLKDFYKTCVDLDTLEKQGSEPLKEMLRRLGGWPVVEGSQWDESKFDWIDTLISFRKLGYDYQIMLKLHVFHDPRNTMFNVLFLEDPDMGNLMKAKIKLGLDDSKIVAHYRMMVKAANLLGADESTAERELLDVVRFEIALIKIISKGVDYKKFYKEYTIAELEEVSPQVPWLKFINGILLNYEVYENETFLTKNLYFLKKFADLITSTEKRVIANYMLWRAVLQSKDCLSEEWRDIENEYQSSKKGKFAGKPRWKQCLSMLDEKMRIGLNSFYVRHYFSDETKDETIIIMKYIHKEFLRILEENDWMDEETKKYAKEKANAIKAIIGYPDELRNDTFLMETYENLTFTSYSCLQNNLIYRKWDTDIHFSTLRKVYKEEKMPLFITDVDGRMLYIIPSLFLKSEREESVLEATALYQHQENIMMIPVGILQDTFYDKDRPHYMNFGAIGFVIGHEITHGFDNRGRHYDKDGIRFNWWDKESDEHFRKKVKCIIDQYDNYTTDIGLKVNGEKTQDENIADNGGLKEAYLAYRSWTKDHGVEPLLPGVNYTQNQLFWLSAAQVSCSKLHPKKLIEMLLSNPHSPGKFRVIGPMSNLAEFSKDFNCSPDAPMNRKYKCEVW